MKKIVFYIIVISFGFQTQAQILDRRDRDRNNNDEFKTIFGPDQANGGYGGLYVAYSEIDQSDAIIIGARGSFIIGHGFGIGIGGAGFINEFQSLLDDSDGYRYNLSGGYGGLVLEPILLPKFPVHISVPVLLGVGGVAYSTRDEYYDFYPEDTEAFVLVEPAVELEFNITRFFRFSFMASYRYTSDIHFDTHLGFPTDVLNGFSGGISFKFGKF